VHENEGILVAIALENWTDIHFVASRFIDYLLHKKKDLDGRVAAFIEDDPARAALVARKVYDRALYQEELESLGTNGAAEFQ